jgi:hypothetical protein
MAYPATYDIKYYRGDTLEFRVFPKNASGAAFDLSTFSGAKFTIADARGDGATRLNGFAEIRTDSGNNLSYIVCAILPGIGTQLDPNVQYVYDVEVNKTATPYPYVYTLVTGTISVTDHVSGAI